MTLHDDEALTRAYRFAQSCAVTEHARGRSDEERQWLDVLALLDLARHPAPTVSDGEREGLWQAIRAGRNRFRQTDNQTPEIRCLIDAILAAGYRKPTLPSVDAFPDVYAIARAIDPVAYPYLNHIRANEWEACVKIATAVLDLLKRGA